MKRLLLLVLVLVGVWSCGDDERPGVIPSGEGGRPSVPSAGSTNAAGADSLGGGGADAGAGGEGFPVEAGSGGETGPNPAGSAPVVTVTSPAGLADPASGKVLTDHELEVVCLVQPSTAPGAAPIDPSSVMIQLLDAGGSSVKETSGVSTGEPGEFSATLLVPADLPNGRVGVRCSASDTAVQPHLGTDLVETFFDSGPLITIREPAKDSPHALRGAIKVEFFVDPSPLGDPDPGAAIDDVSLVVHGVPIETTVAGNLYSASIDLNDLSKFPVTPTDTVPVAIKAVNERQVERRSDYSFLIDSVGPEIVIESPLERAIVGGQEPLVFTVRDDKIGVDPDSIVVYINQEAHRFDGSASWTPQGNRYSFRYDWAQVGTDISQVSVNVRALDFAGNPAVGASRLFHVDNIPPYISLDPPNVREIYTTPPSPVCSPPFPPLFDAAGDRSGLGATAEDFIAEHVLLRAFVYERTNEAQGQHVLYFAGTKPSSVRLYVQPDPRTPLLTDLRGNDGLCDDIHELDELRFEQLSPLLKAGNMVGGAARLGDPPVFSGVCGDADEATDRPCGRDTDMVTFLFNDHLSESLIYAVSPEGDLQDPGCSGITLQIRRPKGPEGWVCVAAVVEDGVGNRDVSEPIRLCLSDNDPSKCPLDAIPTCTDGCDPTTYDAHEPERRWEIPLLDLRK